MSSLDIDISPFLQNIIFSLGTYKLKKVDLQNDGFDIHKVSDNMYYFSGSKYVPLDITIYDKILSGQMRL